MNLFGQADSIKVLDSVPVNIPNDSSETAELNRNNKKLDSIYKYGFLTDSSSKKIMLANVKTYEGVDKYVDEIKVDAALNIICGLSKDYSLIPVFVRDSVARMLSESEIEPNILNIAKELKVDVVVFVLLNKLKNMLRAELVAKETSGDGKTLKGSGYSLLHFLKNNIEPVYDPTLLQALQRAFASAMGDSAMFENAPGVYNVKPAKTLVIGGLMYEDDPALKDWDIFTKKEITSYDAVETIFATAIQSPDYAVYDTDSRDSIYAIFNMYGIENCKAPTTYEIEALHNLQVQMYITGVFKKTKEGVDIEIYLCDLTSGKLEVVKSEKGFLKEDDIDDMRAELKRITTKLLGLKERNTVNSEP